MKLYMLITADKLELPVAVENSVAKLAKCIGVKEICIYKSVYQQSKIQGKYRAVRVEIEEDAQSA